MRSITPTSRRAAVPALLAGAAACSGGDGGLGSTCETSRDCASSLHCVADHCVERCNRGPDCGDGYGCDERGACVPAVGEAGDSCAAETECVAGLACVLDDDDRDGDGTLEASCRGDLSAGPAGAACASDDQCRNRTCALGHCVDTCAIDRDCGDGQRCTSIPRIEVDAAPMFLGCLPDAGSITWRIPVATPRAEFLLPVPAAARSVVLSMSVDAAGQRVGAQEIRTPTDQRWYRSPLSELEYYQNPVRHLPREGRSFVSLPGNATLDLAPGAYPITVSSYRFFEQTGTATPTVWATIKLDDGDILDLHFIFLDLDEHACEDAMDGPLNALSAAGPAFEAYLTALKQLLALSGVDLGTTTFTDRRDLPEFDSLTASELPRLLTAGATTGGMSVFLVRTIEPMGTAALVESVPGAPLDVGVGPGGVAISMDSMCYRSWDSLARITAHAIGRHLGLARNVEPTGQGDPIGDSDTAPTNLMFYSELGGAELSVGQRVVLGTSPVLR